MSFRRKSSDYAGYVKSAAKKSPFCYQFRVRMRRHTGPAEVVWLTSDLKYAQGIVDCLNSQGSHIAAWVDQWIPSGRANQWSCIYPTLPTVVRTDDPATPRKQLVRSGDIVEAVLLSERTRRRGWKAQLTETGSIGPITNSDSVPTTSKPNTTVWLRVGATNSDGTHLQLVWVE